MVAVVERGECFCGFVIFLLIFCFLIFFVDFVAFFIFFLHMAKVDFYMVWFLIRGFYRCGLLSFSFRAFLF